MKMHATSLLLTLLPTLLPTLVAAQGTRSHARGPAPSHAQGRAALHGLENLGISGTYFFVTEELVLFNVIESVERIDLNGDGDQNDAVVHLFELASGVLRNTGYAGGVNAAGGHILLLVQESAQGAADLNGDGDALDIVPHIYHFKDGSSTSLGTALASRPFSSPTSIIDGRVLLGISECENGGNDLNADGDATDVV